MRRLLKNTDIAGETGEGRASKHYAAYSPARFQLMAHPYSPMHPAIITVGPSTKDSNGIISNEQLERMYRFSAICNGMATTANASLSSVNDTFFHHAKPKM
ncbi:hypothetical protein [Cupriavidus neocaledonicus]|uniref:hypothetical protein n=1 Tax=Cupriavidus neocaledonicus TaxID=1040979 RepID=UPI000E20180A|nr:hypothetical protein [Cupriavidus neocaledonicus]